MVRKQTPNKPPRVQHVLSFQTTEEVKDDVAWFEQRFAALMPQHSNKQLRSVVLRRLLDEGRDALRRKIDRLAAAFDPPPTTPDGVMESNRAMWDVLGLPSSGPRIVPTVTASDDSTPAVRDAVVRPSHSGFPLGADSHILNSAGRCEIKYRGRLIARRAEHDAPYEVVESFDGLPVGTMIHRHWPAGSFEARNPDGSLWGQRASHLDPWTRAAPPTTPPTKPAVRSTKRAKARAR